MLERELPKEFDNIYIAIPQKLYFPNNYVPLSYLYSKGYFISEIFGTVAWVISSRNNFRSHTRRLYSPIPDYIYQEIKRINNEMYKEFLDTIQQ